MKASYSNNKPQKFYIGSLPGNAKESTVFSIFKYYGKILDLRLIKDRKTKKCAGFGFITFEVLNQKSHMQLSNILSDPHLLMGREIKVERHLSGESLQRHTQGHKNKRIFVGNLPKGLSDAMLSNYFSRFGDLESAYRVKIQSENRLTNYGYVTFLSEEPVQAILAMEKIPGRGVNLEILDNKIVKVKSFVKGGSKKVSGPKNKKARGKKIDRKNRQNFSERNCNKAETYPAHDHNSFMKSSQIPIQGNSYRQRGEISTGCFLKQSKKFKKRPQVMHENKSRSFEKNQLLIQLRLKPTHIFYHQLVNIEHNSYHDNLRFNK